MMTAVNKHLICSYTLMNTFICEREAARKAPKTWWPVLRMRLERDILFILSIHTHILSHADGENKWKIFLILCGGLKPDGIYFFMGISVVSGMNENIVWLLKSVLIVRQSQRMEQLIPLISFPCITSGSWTVVENNKVHLLKYCVAVQFWATFF